MVAGSDGWLYLASEFAKECHRGQPPAQVVGGIRRLQKILAASGRAFVFTLAPDKSTVVPDHLPSAVPERACAEASKTETFRLLADAAIPGYVDSKALVESRQRAEKRDYYMRKDTHWNELATAALAVEFARKLDPSLLRDMKRADGVRDYVGDLTTLLGAPKSDKTLTTTLTRTGVTSTAADVNDGSGYKGVRTRSTTTAAPLIEGRSLLVGDSFGEAAIPSLQSFFADLQWVHTGEFATIPRTLVATLKEAHTVVLVWTERYFSDPKYGVLWSSQFLDKLAATLGVAGT